MKKLPPPLAKGDWGGLDGLSGVGQITGGDITLPTGYVPGIYQKLSEYWAPMISALLL